MNNLSRFGHITSIQDGTEKHQQKLMLRGSKKKSEQIKMTQSRRTKWNTITGTSKNSP